MGDGGRRRTQRQRSAVFPERAREIQQLGRVFRAFHSQIQHPVVAGLLAFEAQARARHPQQRVEPIDGSHDLRRDLDDPISPPDVGELMTEDDAGAIAGPFARGARQDHLRPDQSPGDQQRRVVALQQQHRPSEAVLPGHLVRKIAPDSFPHRASFRGNPRQPRQPDQQHAQADCGAGDPDGNEPLHQDARSGGIAATRRHSRPARVRSQVRVRRQRQPSGRRLDPREIP